MKRRIFLKKAALSTYALSAVSLMTYASNLLDFTKDNETGDLKLSLAQWSLNRQFFNGLLDPNDFANIAKNTYGINAVEYVSQFYKDSAKDEKFWIKMKERADRVGVNNLLMMVDDEGDLGIANDTERIKSIENHYKWVDAAKMLGCHSIRVNAFGDSDKSIYSSAIVDSMGRLADNAAKENINVVIENHGLYSSDAKLITDIIKQVDKSNFGALPDFGNWCLSAKWGGTQGECNEEYNRYQGVLEFLPYAKGISAKSYDFNEKGEDAIIDYYKMLKIIKDFGFKGHIGIEYEGVVLSEYEGILATKALIEKVWRSLE